MIKTPGLYTLINDIVGYAVLAAVFVFFLVRKELSCTPLRLGCEKTANLRQKNKFLSVLFSKGTWIVLNAGLYAGVYYLGTVFIDVFPFLSNNTYFTLNNYFAVLYFGPILMIAAQLIFGMDFRQGTDLLTPFCALEMGLGKVACFCAGCCYGVPWDPQRGGTYNYTTGRTEFPVQLLEAFVGILLAAVFFFLLTKRKSKGKIYPWYMILYSVTRFLTEFLRGDHVANWLGMKPYQILCLIGILAGAVWLGVIRILEKKNVRFLYDSDLVAFLLAKKKRKKDRE